MREATISIAWVDRSDDFYRSLVAAAGRQFGIREAALLQPLHDPALNFFRSYSQGHPRVRSGETIRVRVSLAHAPGRMPEVTNVTVTDGAAAAAPIGGPPTLPPLSSPVWGPSRVTGEALAGLLANAGHHGWSNAVADFVVRGGQVDLAMWRVAGTQGVRRAAPVSANRAATTMLGLLTGGSYPHPVAYTANFEVRNGEWDTRSWTPIAAVEPQPENPPANAQSPGRPGRSEDEVVIEDVQSYRRVVLNAAAAMIDEQDPRRIENVVGMIAPFAIGRLGKLAQLRRLASLRRLRIPRVVQMTRGRYHVNTAFNPRLAERAREIRATQAGIRADDFRQFNVAVAEVRINGRTELLDAGNVTGASLGGGRGFDSEQLISQQVVELRRRGNQVEMVQLYSERIPCRTCQEVLNTHFADTPIYYTVPEMRGASRGEALMRAYGIEP